MKRVLFVLLSAVMLSGVAAVPATASPVLCNRAAMRTIVSLGYGVFSTPLASCTFRLFLTNDQQGRLSWTGAEYFHGGAFFEVLPQTIAERGWTRADVERYYHQIEQHLFWGKASTPDGRMVELTLKRGPIYRLDEAVPENGWPAGTLLQETYFDFPPQAPRVYKWRYTYEDAVVFGSSLTRGLVQITGPE